MAQETSGLTKYDEAEDSTPVKLADSETDSDTSEETERLHSKIEETRDNMSETIDAIQERLSLSNLSEQVSEKVGDVIESAKDTVYDATIGKVVNFMKQTSDGVKQTSMGKTILANPLPFALIGAGSAMLIYHSYSKKGRNNQMSKYRTKEYFAPVGGESSTADKLSDKAGNAYDAISDKASTAMDTISQKASDTYAGAADMAGRAYDKVGEFGSSAKESYDYYVEEKPLAVAAAALAVGAAVGFAFPSTNYEGRMMGDARDELLSKAEDTATEFVDKAKEVASDAVQAVKKETNSPSTGTQNF